MNYNENPDFEIPTLNLFKVNKYSNASEVFDTERNIRLVVVERGINDEQLLQQEFLSYIGINTLDCIETDYDSLLFHVPDGSRTIGASMQAFSQNVNHIEHLRESANNVYLPFYELGKQLNTIAEKSLHFKVRDSIIEKFIIVPDAVSQHGLKIALLPPYDLRYKPNLHLGLAKSIQEISKVDIDVANKTIMLDSLLAGYVDK